MLGSLRKGAHSFFAKVLMGLLVVSFALWGIGDIVTSSGTTQSVAMVGEESISAQEFDREMQKLKQSFGENFSPELLKSFNLYAMKLDEMINRKLIQNEIKRLGIMVGDDELLAEIARDPNFHNANGDFDKPLFLKTLQRAQISENEYLESVRTELAVRVLLSTFSQYSLVPPALSEALYASQHEKRKLELVVLAQPPAADTPSGDDEALQKFYDTRKTNYVAPEYRSFSYITITPEAIYDDIEISRQELFDIYTQRTSDFRQPEQRDLDQLLYTNKGTAQEAYAALRSGKKMDEVIILAPPVGGKPTSLGFKEKDTLPAGAEEVFALDKGEFTVPVQSPFGWHVFLLKEIKTESTAPFDTVKDALKEELMAQRANAMLTALLEQFEDALSAGKPLKEAADMVELTYHTTDPIDRFGQRSDNSAALDREKHESLLRTAFSLEQGEHSELTGEPDGSYFMVQLDSVTPPRERTFDEIRGKVADDYKAYTAKEALSRYAKEVSTLLSSQNSLPAIEKALTSVSVKEKHLVVVDRSGAVDKGSERKLDSILSPALLAQAYALPAVGTVTKAVPFEGGYALALLQDILPAPSTTETEEGRKLYKGLKRSLFEDYQNEIFEQYLRYLRTQYPVTQNQAMIEAVIGTK